MGANRRLKDRFAATEVPLNDRWARSGEIVRSVNHRLHPLQIEQLGVR
jgi:hypothetical protein